MNNKPTAAIVVESTIYDQMDADLMILGEPIPGVAEKLAELGKTHYLLLVSAFTRLHTGVNILTNRLYADAIPFDEIWMGSGIPQTDRRYDNGSARL